jgi:outer membrane protein OmpA-like peptidoglycan-associated protein
MDNPGSNQDNYLAKIYNLGIVTRTYRSRVMRKLVILASIFSLGACSSPPKPPVVDGTNRSPVNSVQASEKIASQINVAHLEEQKRLESRVVVSETKPAMMVVARSNIYSVYFPYNSARFKLTSGEARRIIPALANARRIEIRGRTDGKRPSVADERIALSRALAAQRFLIGQGVSPAIISVNYVSAGDYVADNFAATGRALNRRVDIEVFNR